MNDKELDELRALYSRSPVEMAATMNPTHQQAIYDVQKLVELAISLRQEIRWLRVHPTLADGMRGEQLALEMLGGTLTEGAGQFDLLSREDVRVEVKYSGLHTPMPKWPKHKRWTWSKPLGHADMGREYDYLLLIGEKDSRYDYGDNSPYVFFLVPHESVVDVSVKGGKIGLNVQISTNLETLRAERTKMLASFKKTYSELIHHFAELAPKEA